MRNDNTVGMLRRLAPRVLRVHERHRSKGVGLLAYDRTLVVAAKALIEHHDLVEERETARKVRREAALGSVEDLRKKLWVWATYIAADLPGFDPASYGQARGAPDGVLDDARRLLAVVAGRERVGLPLPYAPELREAVREALTEAEAEWNRFERMTGEVSDLQRLVREAACRFEAGLVGYRHALVGVLGPEHPDFRGLQDEHAFGPELGELLPEPPMKVHSPGHTGTPVLAAM